MDKRHGWMAGSTTKSLRLTQVSLESLKNAAIMEKNLKKTEKIGDMEEM